MIVTLTISDEGFLNFRTILVKSHVKPRVEFGDPL